MISAPVHPNLPGAFAQRLEANLRALRARQPDIAAEVAHAPIPRELTPVLGRDGTSTFLVQGENGREWWGRCSMPFVAAEELTAPIPPQGGSVTLPSILTGVECMVLAKKLAPRFAIFIVDTPASFRIAFMLHDYTALLNAGRVVLFTFGGLQQQSRAFFARHPGYAISPTLLKVPQYSHGELANLARNLEDAGAAAMQAQLAFIGTQVDALRPDSKVRLSSRPRLAIFSILDSSDAIERARQLEVACNTLEMPKRTCLPLTPDRCHAAARLEAAAQHRAEVVLYVSTVSSEERRFYPVDMPVISWPAAGAIPSLTGATLDVLAVENKIDRDKALTVGWPARQIVVLEPSFSGDGAEFEQRLSPSSPIHLLMDLPDDRPESAGVTLPSQIALWQALQQEVLRRADRFTLDDAGDVLRRAQQTSGTAITDAELLAQFQTWLCERIAPATVARAVARDMVRGGLTPQIWGRNWPAIGRGEDLRRGDMDGQRGEPRLDSPAWIVLPWFQPAAVRLALEFMSRGCAVLVRGRRDDFTSLYPGLGELADAIFWFESKSAAAHLRSLMSQFGKIQQAVHTAAEAIHARHTLAHRLQTLLDFLGELQRSGKGR